MSTVATAFALVGVMINGSILQNAMMARSTVAIWIRGSGFWSGTLLLGGGRTEGRDNELPTRAIW
jgi:hypothetical protein